MNPITITVYGAEEKCASCIHLPSALETMEWLEAAVNRKYPEKSFQFVYCDIEAPVNEEQKIYAQKILNDEYFYPLVVIDDEIVAEGNPRLPDVYKKIEEYDPQ
ncbi:MULTISPECIES: YuzD family protein [Bacillaceae]|uniref:YuzD family protein n=1 Tax=Evansella alkalicola TaxID=745819 RepID=A0ABS6JY36_9BACI|nr:MULTISPECIES: YuzD family protein [Bacillaceae]MBU9722127.1 YuzD family protein [Bacillus alkalicola]